MGSWLNFIMQVQKFGGGAPPQKMWAKHAKWGPYGVENNTVRKSVGEFLLALLVHSNFSSIFMHFRDIAAFVLQHAIFPHPTSCLPKISHVPVEFWATMSEDVGLLVSKISNLHVCDHNPPTSQTDGRYAMASSRFTL